ncbi:MAG: hypothetical protein QM755_09245 [Luteolibacter sp.]
MSLELSKKDRDRILEMVADRIVTELKAEIGGSWKRWIIIPLTAVAAMWSSTSRTIEKLMPVTKLGPKSFGVTAESLDNYVTEKTTHPKKEKAA